MIKREPCIYKIENLIDGKVYIGQTTRSFEIRKKQHKTVLNGNKNTNKKLQNAWNKYGESNFKFEIIDKPKFEELDEKEIFYIEKFESFKSGYNLTTGGNQVMHNKKHSISAKEKMSNKVKAKWQDDEFKNKMKERTIYYGDESPRAIKVICVNDGEVFGTMKQAAQHYGISLDQVSTVCSGKCKYTGLKETGKKLQFKRYEKNKIYTLEDVKHKNEKKKVICLNTGVIFESCKEASGKMGVSYTGICKACNGKSQYSGKMEDGSKIKWAFYDEHLCNS